MKYEMYSCSAKVLLLCCCRVYNLAGSSDPMPIWERFLCGMSDIEPRAIINGLRVRDRKMPWTVFLQVRFNKPRPLWGNCGGTILTKKHILTAGHCFENHLGQHVLIRYGSTVLDQAQSQLSTVFEAHPRYNDDNLENDVAVITLPKALHFTEHVRPACFPKNDVQLTGLTGVIAGWGHTSPSGQKGYVSPYLQFTTQTFMDQEYCFKKLGSEYYNVSTMLCAYKATYDACQGDSGGGILVPFTNRFYIVGIISFGVGCGDVRYPGAYSNVQAFRNWLTTKVHE
ncbi:trypsin alpha-3-like isoform X2 [Ornithodoros turicata]|uniref:trypsin alpha-3-like isoform X2 n=1 Tax=Ornithodoros turicata TaxID=34597 RepID=UPI00313A0B46